MSHCNLFSLLSHSGACSSLTFDFGIYVLHLKKDTTTVLKSNGQSLPQLLSFLGPLQNPKEYIQEESYMTKATPKSKVVFFNQGKQLLFPCQDNRDSSILLSLLEMEGLWNWEVSCRYRKVPTTHLDCFISLTHIYQPCFIVVELNTVILCLCRWFWSQLSLSTGSSWTSFKLTSKFMASCAEEVFRGEL